MRKVAHIIAALLCIVALGGGIFVLSTISSKKTQQDIFYASMDEFCDAIIADGASAEKIDELANTINSSENYALVEKAAKMYLRDIFVPYLTALETEKKSVFKDGITKEFIESEQPEFKDALNTIDEMEEAISVTYIAADTNFSKEAALEYISDVDETFDEFYEELFLEQVEEIYSDEEMKNDLINYYFNIYNQCEKYREIIRFLIANNGSWQLDGDAVIFKTTALTNQYNQLVEKYNQK